MSTSIQQEALISAPPGEVYRALVDPQVHAAFTGALAAGDTVVGGHLQAWDGYIDATILELVEGQRVVWAWKTSEWPEQAPLSRVEITLEAAPAGTRLRMVYSEVPPSQAEQYRQGWLDYYWEPLAQFFKER